MVTSSNKRGQFWRADWFVGVLVVLAVLALHGATGFGIARSTDSSKTKTGLVLGTPSFMSPEPVAGKKDDGRSDLYPLGGMLFQMLAGVLPFRGDPMAEVSPAVFTADDNPAFARTIAAASCPILWPALMLQV